MSRASSGYHSTLCREEYFPEACGDWSSPSEELGSTVLYRSKEDLEKKVKLKRQAIDRTLSKMRKAQDLDLLFLVDCTGSMSPWISGVKDNIYEWNRRLSANHRHLNPRVAFIRYTDFDQPEASRTTMIDFTRDLDKFKAFVGAITTPGGVGGDSAEDVFGGLEAVSKLSWRETGTKVLVHIADRPCHGSDYHDDDIGDDYPSGDPERRMLDLIMRKIVNREIYYHFGYIQESATAKMMEVFDKCYLEQGNRTMAIETFDASQPAYLDEAVFRQVSSSISSSVTRMTATDESQKRLRDFTLAKGVPNWARIESHKVLVTPLQSSSPQPRMSVNVKRSRNPFAKGGVRLVYHAYLPDSKIHCVFKEHIRQSSFKRCVETLKIQQVAASYAVKFNQEKPSCVKINLEFIPIGVVECPKDIDGEKRYYNYEKFIEGKYEKFNGNNGYVTRREDPLSDACQAFSHYTWVESGKRLVVCDIQGVKTSTKILLTDPAIHDTHVLLYGATNLGIKGIRLFFQTHTCNHICRKMNLPGYVGY